MIMRAWRHLITTRFELRQDFPESRLAEIAATVARAESEKRGQIVVALEAALHLENIFDGLSAGDRARHLFGDLRVWDTESNNGVLIYLLLADHAIEIVADRHAARNVQQADWDRIAQSTAALCAAGRYSDAILQAVEQVREILPPDQPSGAEANELPDRPVML
jgi:uncharacterized membrane protein